MVHVFAYGGTSSIDAVGVVAPVVRVWGDWLLEKRDSSLYVLSLALVSELMIEGVEMERSRDTFLSITLVQWLPWYCNTVHYVS